MGFFHRSTRATVQLVGRHGIALLAIALGTFAHAVVMSDGRLASLTERQYLGSFYDALGDSLLEGRFDVPPEAIGNEALIIDGRAYGYFGPTPALLRIPLNWLLPSMWGRWACVTMLVFCALTLVALYSVYLTVGQLLGRSTPGPPHEQYATALFLLCAALGTTLLFIGRRSSVFHEAISGGVAFGLWAFAFLLAYLARGGLHRLVLSVLSGLLSYLARGSVGSGPLAALAILLAALMLAAVCRSAERAAPGDGVLRRRLCGVLRRGLGFFAIPSHDRCLRHGLVLAGLLAASMALAATRNVLTLGNLAGVPPLGSAVQIMSDPERLARTGGQFVQPTNLPTILRAYFGLEGIRIRDRFPWFAPVSPRRLERSEAAQLDGVEPFVSVPAAYPFWSLLALVGLVVAFRPRSPVDRAAPLRLVLLGAAVGGSAILVAAYVSLRYLHDLFPLLTISAAAGMQQILVLYPSRRSIRALMPALILLGLFTCIASAGVASAVPRWH